MRISDWSSDVCSSDLAELDTLFSRVPVTVRHHGSQPYYQPSGDQVVMPEFADFHTSDDYYSTLAHELCHATGHVDRLARPTLISTKREDYAREELVALSGQSADRKSTRLNSSN